jgi:4-amino-4-deoxy-L-arabinose transferase-like glycosyltransferase
MLITIALLIAVCGILFYKLGSLTPALSKPEVETASHLTTRDLGLREIIEEPVYLPYKLSIYIFEKLGFASPFIARSLSALIGFATVVSFYYILSRWHTNGIALLGTLLFLTSSWFLHTVRLATSDPVFLLLLPLIACGAWLNDTQRRDHLTLAAAALTAGILLYVPGMVWFILAGLIWQRKRVRQALASLLPWQMLLVGVLGVMVLAPMAIAGSDNPSSLLQFLGLPEQAITWQKILASLLEIPRQLFVHGPRDPARWLGATPLLDAFTTAMFIIGLYASYFRLRLDRTKLLLFGLVVGSLLIVFDTGRMSILLPLVYILVAAGITFMLQQWFTVFPRNPLARSIGWSLITAAIVISSFYNLTHYFIAWPNAPTTKSVFQERV